MTSSTDRETNAGAEATSIPRRLPALVLHENNHSIPLYSPELGSRVLLLLRAAHLNDGRSYIAALESSRAEIRDWYADVLLVREDSRVPTTLLTAQADSGQWDALGVPAGESALIIADRWGEVYVARHSTSVSDFPAASEIEQWVRFLATQCPECGVIDEPGYGEWTP
jgi:hypothetical protein